MFPRSCPNTCADECIENTVFNFYAILDKQENLRTARVMTRIKVMSCEWRWPESENLRSMGKYIPGSLGRKGLRFILSGLGVNYIQALPWDTCHLWISMSRATLLLVPVTSDSSSAAEQHHTKDRAESRAFSQGPGVTWPRWSNQLTCKWSGHLNLRSPQKSQGNLELTVPYLYNI